MDRADRAGPLMDGVRKAFSKKPKDPKRQPSVGVRINNPLAQKTTHIVGESKRASDNSRDESVASLAEGPKAAAARVLEAMHAKQQGLKAFHKVSFALSGQVSAPLIAEYQQQSNGRDLKADLQRVFKSNPGPKAGRYLVDILDHDGQVTLRARLWLLLGDVDRSGAFARMIGFVPIFGNKGDTDRIVELFEAAPTVERSEAWNDFKLNARIKDLDSKVHTRIGALMKVQNAEQQADRNAPGQYGVQDKQRLAEARDEQLAQMVRQYLKALPGSGILTDVVGGVDKLATMAGLSKGMEQRWQYITFASKDFYDDLVEWKAKATAEDIAEVKKDTSKFRAAMRLVPHNVFTGLTASERAFISALSGDAKLGGTESQISAVKGSIERQKQWIGRSGKPGSYAVSMLTTKLAARKWRDISTEVKLLTAEQRKELLDQYDTNPATAMQKLAADLKTAGMDKETRAEIMARFNTEFGNIGENYAALWQAVDPGNTTKLKTFGSHLKPTKWTSIDKAVTGKAKGKKAMKIIFELEDNEFALVRQDKALLAKIRATSDDKTWATILDLLGMQSIDDQLSIDSTRETVHQAQLQGESAKRFAILLDQVIEKEYVLRGMSAGRDKAQLYTIADKAQSAAKLKAREDGTDPVVFLGSCLTELEKLSDDGAKKVYYLRKHVPQVFAVFTNNTPIPAEDRIKRAKHEGFGIGDLRKVDRQKLEWTFATLSGKQLLDQWSNLHEFVDMKKEMKEAEAEIKRLSPLLANPGGPGQGGGAEQDKIRQEFEANTALLGSLYGRMNAFTLGIKKERRTDLKKIGVNAQDRIKFEGLVTEKLADAMDDDPEVQAILDEVGVDYDKFMIAKMKGVDALEMQRYLDTTRQWHLFSTKSSELGEATRVVKGKALGTEQKVGAARSEGKSKSEIADLRKAGAEQTEEAIHDRRMIEARFRDMQATFRQRAMVLFKLIVTAIVTAVVAAATYGAGTPMVIAIHAGLELGFNALQVMYQYYVLGDRDLKRLAVTFALGLLDSALRIMTANLAAGLSVSLLHPGNIPGELVDWVAPALMKGMNKVVQGTVMFAPNYVVERAFHDKALEKVVKEGEGDIVEDSLKMLGKETSTFMRKMLLAAVKQGIMPMVEGQISGGGQPAQQQPQQKGFGQAMTDRMLGGATKDESDDMWNRYQKQKQKAFKKDAIKMVVKGPDTTETKDAEKDAHKRELKDMREKEAKSDAYKVVAAVLLSEDLKLGFRRARGDAFRALLAHYNVPVVAVRGLSDDEKGKIEKELHMTPGQLDRELQLSPDAEAALRAFAPYVETYDATTVDTLVDSLQLNAMTVLRLKAFELAHIALTLGIDLEELRADLRRTAARRFLTTQPKAQNPKAPPPVPPQSSKPQRRTPVPST